MKFKCHTLSYIVGADIISFDFLQDNSQGLGKYTPKFLANISLFKWLTSISEALVNKNMFNQ